MSRPPIPSCARILVRRSQRSSSFMMSTRTRPAPETPAFCHSPACSFLDVGASTVFFFPAPFRHPSPSTAFRVIRNPKKKNVNSCPTSRAAFGILLDGIFSHRALASCASAKKAPLSWGSFQPPINFGRGVFFFSFSARPPISPPFGILILPQLRLE